MSEPSAPPALDLDEFRNKMRGPFGNDILDSDKNALYRREVLPKPEDEPKEELFSKDRLEKLKYKLKGDINIPEKMKTRLADAIYSEGLSTKKIAARFRPTFFTSREESNWWYLRLGILCALGLVFFIIMIVVKMVAMNDEETQNFLELFTVTEPAERILEKSPTGFPKIIWFYWDGLPHPFMVKCFESWKKFGFDWQIKGVNARNYLKYLNSNELPSCHRDIFKFWTTKNLEHRHRVDCIKLAILNKYGGVWVDPTVMMNRILTEWVGDVMDTVDNDQKRVANKDLIAFYNASFSTSGVSNDVMETWFIATRRGTEILKGWKDVFFKEIDFKVDGEVTIPTDDTTTKPVDDTTTKPADDTTTKPAVVGIDASYKSIMERTDTQKLIACNLLLSNVALMNARQTISNVKSAFASEKVILIKAEDSAFFLHNEASGSESIIPVPESRLLEHEASNFESRPIYLIKLKTSDQKHIEEYMRKTGNFSFPSGTAIRLVYNRALD